MKRIKLLVVIPVGRSFIVAARGIAGIEVFVGLVGALRLWGNPCLHRQHYLQPKMAPSLTSFMTSATTTIITTTATTTFTVIFTVVLFVDQAVTQCFQLSSIFRTLWK